MTVGDLMDELAKCDRDMEVGVHTGWEGDETLAIGSVSLCETGHSTPGRDTDDGDEVQGPMHVRIAYGLARDAEDEEED